MVQTGQGRLRGTWEAGRSVAVFKGVPYAAPPLGPLRWRPPERAIPWPGVRAATRYAPVAPQLGVAIEHFMRLLLEGQGYSPLRLRILQALIARVPRPRQHEDCLYLNVRTPALGRASKLPVMVWQHGGDHRDGSGSDPVYQSNTLPLYGVVLVTINYRLGVIGNLAHPELSAESPHGISGNYGTLDQIAALRWVRDNIPAFGGDPDRVTIFGESAGGESVAHMMSSPLARGLFHRAILQSPGNSGQMRHLRHAFLDAPASEQRGVGLAERLGLGARRQLAALRAQPYERIYTTLRQEPHTAPYYPTIDGHVLPHSPFSAFASGAQARVPVLVGSNRDEGTLVYPLANSPLIEHRLREHPEDRMPAYMAETFGEELDELLALYPGIERRERAAESALLGDSMFGAKTRLYAEQVACTGQPAYLYMFARTPPSPRQTAGAAHAAEIPYVHGVSSPLLRLHGPDGDLADRIGSYWTNFAKTGDPNGHGLAPWTPFDPRDPRWLHLDIEALEMRASEHEQAYAIFNRRTARHVEAMKQLTAKNIAQSSE